MTKTKKKIIEGLLLLQFILVPIVIMSFLYIDNRKYDLLIRGILSELRVKLEKENRDLILDEMKATLEGDSEIESLNIRLKRVSINEKK